MDRERIGYYGLSWGAALAPIPLALEPRFRTAVLASGGLFWMPMRPDADPASFLPRVKLPVLMINGEHDSFYIPLSRRKFFELLGSSADRKKAVDVAGAGHVAPRSLTMSETLAWLDRHLGPVQRR